MASFWNGTGGAQLTNLVNRLKPQTGKPQTGTPNTNPQAGFPNQIGSGGPPNTGNPNGQVYAGPPLGGPITYTGSGSGNGAPPGASGGTGAWERMQGQESRGGIPGIPPQISGGGPPNTGTPGGPMVGFPHQWGQPTTAGWGDAPKADWTNYTPQMGSSAGGSVPGAAGGTPRLSQFTATDNLIGTQFNPTPGAQTQGAMDATNGALSQYMNQPLGGQYGAVTPGRSADTQQLQGYAQNAAGNYIASEFSSLAARWSPTAPASRCARSAARMAS